MGAMLLYIIIIYSYSGEPQGKDEHPSTMRTPEKSENRRFDALLKPVIDTPSPPPPQRTASTFKEENTLL
jgi:hypothetical protein